MLLILIAATKPVYKWASQPHNTWLKSIPIFVTGLCQRTWAVNMKKDVKLLWGICVFCTQQETFLNSVLWSSLGFIVKMIRKNRRNKKGMKDYLSFCPYGQESKETNYRKSWQSRQQHFMYSEMYRNGLASGLWILNFKMIILQCLWPGKWRFPDFSCICLHLLKAWTSRWQRNISKTLMNIKILEGHLACYPHSLNQCHSKAFNFLSCFVIISIFSFQLDQCFGVDKSEAILTCKNIKPFEEKFLLKLSKVYKS